jgi:predicted amidohydrolase YtcJ
MYVNGRMVPALVAFGAVSFTLLAACGCGRGSVAKQTTAVTSAPVDASAAAAPASVADRIYVGGTVLTINDAQPQAEAVAVKDGKILAVGTRAEIEALKGPSTVVQDLGGNTLLPGFVDAHSHLAGVGLASVAANLRPPPDGPVDSVSALQKAQREWMATSKMPKTYGIVVGFGYDDSQLKEHRHPTRAELDAISTELPVYLVHQSGHIGVANSRALVVLGITADANDPAGGHIHRRKGSKEPDGVLEESAHHIALSQLIVRRIGAKESHALIDAGQSVYLRYGFTTAQDGATDPANVDGYIAAAEAGRLKIDVVSYPLLAAIGDALFMRTPYNGPSFKGHFRIGGVKIVLDGSIQGKTAWLTKPYFKAPPGQPADYRGYSAVSDAEATASVGKAFEKGWQIQAHTNGDAALDQFLNAVSEASKKYPGADRRPVALHAQTARVDQLDRMKQLGVLPSFFPVHTYYWGDWDRDSVLGPERAANISPTGWALQRGMTFTSHHDAPMTLPDSMRVLSATVNRTTRSGQALGPDQRVEPIVALEAMTSWSAYQHFEEKTKGSIEPGKLADFVVLSGNPLTVDRAKLAELKVRETIKEGHTVYTSADE